MRDRFDDPSHYDWTLYHKATSLPSDPGVQFNTFSVIAVLYILLLHVMFRQASLLLIVIFVLVAT